MQELVKFFLTIFTTLCVSLSAALYPATIFPQTEPLDVACLQYPGEAVTTLAEAGLSEDAVIDRLSAELPEYVQSCGYDDIGGVFVSPYYTAKIGDIDVPVYATMVFMRVNDTGAIHSFSEVYVDGDNEFSFNIELKSDTVKLKDAVVLPESHGVGAVCEDGVVTASINKTGIYTFLFNGAKQDYGYTLFVREKVDENAEINEYIEKYGKENVIVFEKGIHELDYLSFVEKDNTVLYLKEGAFLTAKHKYKIRSVEDENRWIEENAVTDNAIGLTRYPFINFLNCDNVAIAGRGVIDLTRLDRRERRGVVFNYCNNVSVSGIKIINSPEWSFITYCCHDVAVEQVDIFGCRGNADGFAICNTENAAINNCFARTADDEFEVKALGGTMGSKNITFSNCVAWGGYARCFGICGEVCKDISDITFRDCAVVYRDGIWDNDRIGSLVITAEQCEGTIDGVVFENIEIFRDEGRPILVKIYDEEKENYTIKNVVFKNISYTSYMPAKIEGNNSDTNTVQVSVENVNANGFKVKGPSLLFKVGNNCNVEFSE